MNRRAAWAAALCACLTGCSRTPEPAAVPDGVWSGTTSQGGDIAVTVKGGAVVALKLGYNLKLDQPCARPGSPVAVNYRGGEAETSFARPIALSGGAFSASVALGDVDARLAGRFAAGALTGTVDMQVAPSSGCSGKESVTFTARRAGPGS